MTSTMRFERWENPTATQSVSFNQLVGGTGLVPIVPPTVLLTPPGGSATANTNGIIAFTSVSSISLNNVFTDDYKNYRMIVNTSSGGSVNSSLYFRFRKNGTDTTSASYYYAGVWGQTTSGPTLWGGSGSSFIDMGRPTVGWSNISCFDIANTRNTGQVPIIDGGFTAHDGNSVLHVSLGGHLEAVSPFDGFTLYTSSGTMNGTVQVFGYKS